MTLDDIISLSVVSRNKKRSSFYQPLLPKMMLSTSRFLIGLTLLQPVLGFVGVPLQQAPILSSTLLRDSGDEHAAPLPLTASDLARLASVKNRHQTMPLLIMDALVPGQTLTFER